MYIIQLPDTAYSKKLDFPFHGQLHALQELHLGRNLWQMSTQGSYVVLLGTTVGIGENEGGLEKDLHEYAAASVHLALGNFFLTSRLYRLLTLVQEASEKGL
jgi:hypothetical protein